MMAYSPMFTPVSGATATAGVEWCGAATFDDPSFYYNGLHQEFDTRDQYPPFNNYDGILGSSFDDLLVIPPPASFVIFPPPLSNLLDAVAAKDEKEELVDEKKKKEDHNASERFRRMKINQLYSSLRSLLPAIHHTKKLSIPVTVGRATKYIAELQNQVQELIEKKEKLLSSATTTLFSQTTKATSSSSLMPISVEAIQMGNGEISIQISALKANAILVPISEVLLELEEEGDVIVVDVSSSDSDSSAGRIFHRIHLMVGGAYERPPTCELLREKVLLLCNRWENLYRFWIH